MSKSRKTLFTANKDVAVSFLKAMCEESQWNLFHLPLECYSYSINLEEEQMVTENIESFSYIIHGNLRNARYFIQWATKMNAIEQVRNTVHLVPNQASVDLLAEFDIPAVMPRDEARPIDFIEFLLRITREGTVLYPTLDKKDEEVPGLLKEMEMPVVEFQVCKEEILSSETLNNYRQKAYSVHLDSIIFHNRSSVKRIQTAFPDLDYDSIECISSGQAVTQKMAESGLSPALEARGSWHSLLSILTG